MKKRGLSVFLAFVVLTVLSGGCSAAPATALPTAVPPTITPSPVPPTATPEPTPTATPIPSPTPLPGSVVLPLETLGKTVPWLPLDKSAIPGVNFIAFNTLKPPFNSALVRRAFAHAIDRDALVVMAAKYKAKDPVHATTLTPPQTLGRDLFGQVGAGFDPQLAKDLLTQAGYSSNSAFPGVTLLVNASGDTAPGARFNMASAMADMWETHLGITVQVEAIGSFNEYNNRLRNDPPDLYWFGWAADVNDPNNFLRELFASGSQYNHGKFSNAEFDRLVNRARIGNPAERQEFYIQAERILCETEAALIPLYHTIYSIP